MKIVDVNLAVKLSRYVHSVCDNVPHDIGLKLAEIIKQHNTEDGVENTNHTKH